MIIAISYGTENFTQSLKLNMWTAKYVGKADRVIAYKPKDIEKDFLNENIKILSNKKGNGYWLWKPYFINETLSNMNDGDYLIYSDSGTFFMNRISYYLEYMKYKKTDIFIGEVDFIEKDYSKRDAFYYIGVDDCGFEKSKQYDAAFLIVKKNNRTVSIMREWLKYSCDYRIISDEDNVCGLSNYDGFIENRYDQTVLSLVLKKYDIRSSFNISSPDPFLTCIEPISCLGKGRFEKYRYEEKNKSERLLNNRYIAPLIVRTRFRNMNCFLFIIKNIILALKYIYRNKICYMLTMIKKHKWGGDI